MGRSNEKILIVDDKGTNRQLLRLILDGTNEGYTILEADSGRSALEIVEREEPDLILLDVMMPAMDGYDVCQKLKSQENLRSIPVVFVTALYKTEDMVKCFSSGASDYIIKPVNAEEVKARVKVHLNTRRAEKALRESEEKFRAIANYSNDLECCVGVDGKLVWINLAVEKITGYSVEIGRAHV